MKAIRTAILHYSAPPIVGGVEAVMGAHARLFREADYSLTVVAGRGEQAALPSGTDFIPIPLMDTRHPDILRTGAALERGEIPPEFNGLADRLAGELAPLLGMFERVIVHNIFTKHFNLPLTAALFRVLETKSLPGCIAWCHDFTWTSPNSRSKVHPGYPWDLLRTSRPEIKYVVVSSERQKELAGLLQLHESQIQVIFNGVDPALLLGFSAEGEGLVERLGLLDADLVLLMPVRVTQAKNIELALHVLSALKTRLKKVRLVVTGPPDPHDEAVRRYFEGLLGLRRELGVEDEARFVFESGPSRGEHFTIDQQIVGELYRASDLLFMPSHREGFGMPVLEAGLSGLRVASSEAVPAAREIGRDEVLLFDPEENPGELAGRLLNWMEADPVYRLRRRVRQELTWKAIFLHEIEPLVQGVSDFAAFTRQLHQRLETGGRLWLFLDYDGTLAEFAPNPDVILPDPELIDLLTRISRLPQIRIAIISGRRLEHVRDLLPVPGLVLAGTYGIELQFSHGERVYLLDFEQARPVLDKIKPRWEELIAGREGFYLEDKGWALALHARFAVDSEAEIVLQTAREAASAKMTDPMFRLLGGDKFLEVCPSQADKGLTVSALLHRLPFPGAELIYIGDDDKDEAAFKIIQARGGKTILVSAQPGPMKADYWMETTRSVREWLSSFLTEIS